jgi:hypothetical protein
MAENNRKDGNQNKQQQPMQKPDRGVERQDGNRQQSGNRGVGGGNDLGKGVGNENREIQKDLDTDETDEGQDLDEQGEITQRNPRMGEDIERK